MVVVFFRYRFLDKSHEIAVDAFFGNTVLEKKVHETHRAREKNELI